MRDEQTQTGAEVASALTKSEITQKWWDEHPEQREKFRQQAIERRASGKLGRPKKRRPAYEVAAVKAALNAEKLAKELIGQALHSESISQRQRAIEILFAAEQRVRQETREQEDHLAHLFGDELTVELMRTLREVTGIEEFAYVDSTAEDESLEEVPNAD